SPQYRPRARIGSVARLAGAAQYSIRLEVLLLTRVDSEVSDSRSHSTIEWLRLRIFKESTYNFKQTSVEGNHAVKKDSNHHHCRADRIPRCYERLRADAAQSGAVKARVIGRGHQSCS